MDKKNFTIRLPAQVVAANTQSNRSFVFWSLNSCKEHFNGIFDGFPTHWACFLRETVHTTLT